MQHIELTDDEFFARFKPVKNHLDDNASYDGHMFETYGAELDFIRAQPENTVWTILDCDGEWVISSRYQIVNRIGYLVCEVPFGDDEHIEVID